MSRLLLAVFTAYISLAVGLEPMRLPPIHWNSSNPMFKTSNNDHIINVNMYDEIDFVCPHYPPGSTSEALQEYYIIYSVTKAEYDNCNIHDSTLTSRRSMVINCSQPESEKVRKYTLIFERFNAFGGFQFQEGQSYYYITTSSGEKEGMHNVHLGACYFENMKLTIKVIPLATPPTSTASTTTSSRRTRPTRPTRGSRPQDPDETTTTPWWWWETPSPRTVPSEEPTFKPPFEEKNNLHNEIDPRKEGLVDSSSLAVPSLVLYTLCWCLTLLLHRIVSR